MCVCDVYAVTILRLIQLCKRLWNWWLCKVIGRTWFMLRVRLYYSKWIYSPAILNSCQWDQFMILLVYGYMQHIRQLYFVSIQTLEYAKLAHLLFVCDHVTPHSWHTLYWIIYKLVGYQHYRHEWYASSLLTQTHR